ncbi:hypothetical protein OIO90_000373 [Microbotryomycetes sp. JL221]|nr:hypothetical protein OIO90_000373 [Microbotryomycetes sp. JL221]
MSVPGRARSTSGTSNMSTPTSVGRRRPGGHVMSPLSSFNASPHSTTPNPLSSSMSQASLPTLNRYPSTASTYAPSAVGSLATTTATTQPGAVRFKRGHARRKANANPLVTQRTINLDELDLMALEDPDEVFRLFGVRDVRVLEKRARDAAEAKVAELRTMVGERYRDLLSAADSIVRMKTASEKLVDRLERIENAVTLSADASLDTPSRRLPPPKLHTRTSSTTDLPRTFAAPPTLSLTLQLFLSLPSIIDNLLDASSHLQAARLEGIGRIIYQELSSHSEEDEDAAEANLKAAFPIIDRQWEIVGSLGTIISRRATADLSNWQQPAIRTAQTLASILLLDNASVADVLRTLLEARSAALVGALKGKASNEDDLEAVLQRICTILGLLLDTVSTASNVFGASPDPTAQPSGLLLRLLQEIQKPSAASASDTDSPQLCPILQTLPNYPALARHLPQEILEFRPFLPLDQVTSFRPNQAQSDIQNWLQSETNKALESITKWIQVLPGGAHTLWLVRDSIRTSLDKSSLSSPYATALKRQLENIIENRLGTVYKSHLDQFVASVSPRLESLLAGLVTSPSDLSTSHHLFESQLNLPPPQYYTSNRAHTRSGKTIEPFESFVSEVDKRRQGRSPLVERGLKEFEQETAALAKDLREWLEPGDDHAQSLRQTFSVAWNEALEGAAEALTTVLSQVGSNIDQSLFLGHVAYQLASSSVFTSNPFNGQAQTGVSKPLEKLQAAQSSSLTLWRSQTVTRCVSKLRESFVGSTVVGPSATSWAWEAARPNASTSQIVKNKAFVSIPSQPSAAVLSSLRTLTSSLWRVGLHRICADKSIVQSFLRDFSIETRTVVEECVQSLTKEDGYDALARRVVAAQIAWDVTFLRQLWGFEQDKAQWDDLVSSLGRQAGLDSSSLTNVINSTLNSLQRTQTILYPLLQADSIESSKTGWLPRGAPNSTIPGSTNEFKSLAGLVKPGPRLGLLPTRS